MTAVSVAACMLNSPSDVLLYISDFLTSEELGKYRLTCRRIEQALRDRFARRFFTTREICVESSSLHTFDEIASHTVFSRQIRKVVLSTSAIHVADYMVNDEAHGLDYNQPVMPEVLLETGRALHLLVISFAKLLNLEEVLLQNLDTGRTLEHGLYLMDPTNLRESFQIKRSMDHSAGSLLLILSVLGAARRNASMLTVKASGCGLLPAAFNFWSKVDDRLAADIVSALLSVEKLSLDLASPHDDRTRFRQASQDLESLSRPHEEAWDEIYIKRFLHRTPSLTSLSINFNMVSDKFANHVLSWLSGHMTDFIHLPANLRVSAPQAYLTNVVNLKLGRASLGLSQIAHVLVQFTHLRSFQLWQIRIVPKDDQSNDDNAWASLFDQVSTGLSISSQLHTFALGYLSQMTRVEGEAEDSHSNVFFSVDDPDHDGMKIPTTEFVKSRGLTIQEWLKILPSQVFLFPLLTDSSDVGVASDSDSF